MNWDRIEGNWKQFSGKAKSKWGKLTDDTLMQAGGKRDQLVGKIQESYGVSRDDAEHQVDAWSSSLENEYEGQFQNGQPRHDRPALHAQQQSGGQQQQFSTPQHGQHGSAQGFGGQQGQDSQARQGQHTQDSQQQGGASGESTGQSWEQAGRDTAAKVGQWAEETRRGVEQRAKDLEHRVHERPLNSLAIAAGVGFLLGVLWASRR